MFGTAFGSFLEPKDSFDSQACWTIHQRREGQTFVESSHFVLRKKKNNNNNCRPPWRLWKNPQSFTILQLASMVGTPRKNTIDQSTLVKLTVRMLDCFTLRNGSHASARFYWGCRQGLSQKEASKNRLGCMRFDWPNKSQIVTRGVLSLRLALTLMPCQRLMNVQPQQLKATQGRTDCRLDFRLSCGRFKWMHSKFHEVFRYFV